MCGGKEMSLNNLVAIQFVDIEKWEMASIVTAEGNLTRPERDTTSWLLRKLILIYNIFF